VLTGALVTAASPESNSGTTAAPAIRLKTISARVTSKGTSLVIEATEPVPYVATRPDPLTLLIDFRNVAADAVTSTVAPDEKSAIQSVAVEQAEAGSDANGLAGPRIRIKLSEPVGYHARASRNTVVIDFDKSEKPDKKSKTPPYVLPPAPPAANSGASGQDLLLSRVDSKAVDPIAALGLNTDASRPRTTPAKADAQAAQGGRVGAALPPPPQAAVQAQAP